MSSRNHFIAVCTSPEASVSRQTRTLFEPLGVSHDCRAFHSRNSGRIQITSVHVAIVGQSGEEKKEEATCSLSCNFAPLDTPMCTAFPPLESVLRTFPVCTILYLRGSSSVKKNKPQEFALQPSDSRNAFRLTNELYGPIQQIRIRSAKKTLDP